MTKITKFDQEVLRTQEFINYNLKNMNLFAAYAQREIGHVFILLPLSLKSKLELEPNKNELKHQPYLLDWMSKQGLNTFDRKEIVFNTIKELDIITDCYRPFDVKYMNNIVNEINKQDSKEIDSIENKSIKNMNNYINDLANEILGYKNVHDLDSGHYGKDIGVINNSVNGLTEQQIKNVSNKIVEKTIEQNISLDLLFNKLKSLNFSNILINELSNQKNEVLLDTKQVIPQKKSYDLDI